MLTRRQFLQLGSIGALAPGALHAQQRLARVGVLSGRSRQVMVDTGIQGAFVKRMQELGHVEGRNIRYEWRNAAGDYNELRRMADELVRLNVDVILAEGTTSIEPARRATGRIPIVMATSSDPVTRGFVASLARPGGNVTGLTSIAVEATAKRVELLAGLVPGLARATVLVNPDNPGHPAFVDEAAAAAPKFNLKIAPLQAKTPGQLQAAFAKMEREKHGGLIVPPDSFFNSRQQQIVELAAKHRVPALYSLREFFESGGLMVYGVDIADMYRRAAAYVDRILKGAKPGDLPVEQPDKFALLVNLRAADAMGLAIPQAFLLRADEVLR